MEPRRYLLPASLMILVVLAIAFLAFSIQNVVATSQRVPPTLAPTATPGPPPPNPTSIPLAQPLATQEQALKQVARYDSQMAVWSEPWSTDTLTLQPGRITIKAYPSRAAESAAYGLNEWFAPEIEADAGSVWAISIKGKATIAIPSSAEGAGPRVYPDGVTYVISARTGDLMTIREILLKK